jgi:flagellar assembly protein FliH
MKSWSENIRLSAPLRDVQIAPPPGSLVWEQRVLERERASFERGRAAGERALGEQLVQQRAEIMDLQSGVLKSLRNALPQLIAESENALIELAMTAAQRFVADIPITSEMVTATVREALQELQHAAECVVLLHPLDLELLQRMNAPLQNENNSGKPLRFQASGEISRGGCLLQTSFGLVDATRENKLDRLRASLAA